MNRITVDVTERAFVTAKSIIEPWAERCWGSPLSMTERARRLRHELTVRLTLAISERTDLLDRSELVDLRVAKDNAA